MTRLSIQTPPPLVRSSIESDCSTASSSPKTPAGLHYNPEIASPIGPDFSGFSFRQRPPVPKKSAFRKSCPSVTQYQQQSFTWQNDANFFDPCSTFRDTENTVAPVKIRKVSVCERSDAQNAYLQSPVSYSRRVSVASLHSTTQLPGPASMSRSVSWLAQRRGSAMSIDMRRESVAEKRSMQAQLSQEPLPAQGRRLSSTADLLANAGTGYQSHWSASDNEDDNYSDDGCLIDRRLSYTSQMASFRPSMGIDAPSDTQYTTVRRISRASGDYAAASNEQHPFVRARRVSVGQARRMSRQRSASSDYSVGPMPGLEQLAKSRLNLAREQAQSDALEAKEVQFAQVMAEITAAHQQEKATLAAEVTLLRRRLATLEAQSEVLAASLF
ncbi:hypothetical protein BCR37DRAFT_262036 [Protomyces lactucae-debilis]|uniref:Uncharacterized protein n=1 Tax=Protomyces lactucae-debilis TaxID=2754530 RepID=A0A1Y2FJX1_PROLT|nr:uncharacterized protein BCR37DRAFT_262036 [Protomyces lactucae-debilis]ORY84261.1 hypothetical protein BCR37DRAFT_262036 [Protomyces lactucae-debilis]